MQILKDRIRKDGKIKAGNVLKVDSFLNHQMDIRLFGEIGKEFKRRFADSEVTKILTIEASGIGIACIVAQYFDVPVVFAKKTQTKNIAGEVYTTKVESFTHGRVYDIIVSKEFLGPDDKVLLIDDFLANGKALEGLVALVKDSGAKLVGAEMCIRDSHGRGVGGLCDRGQALGRDSLSGLRGAVQLLFYRAALYLPGGCGLLSLHLWRYAVLCAGDQHPGRTAEAAGRDCGAGFPVHAGAAEREPQPEEGQERGGGSCLLYTSRCV